MKWKIAPWEAAFAGFKELTSAEWAEVFEQADPAEWEELGEDAPDHADSEFDKAAHPWCLGEVVLDFPNSTHGDGSTVTVYRLPGGTTILRKYSTWETGGPSGMVLRDDDFGSVMAAVCELLFDDRDYGVFQNLDEDDEHNPDANTTFEGEVELRKEWAKALRRKRTPIEQRK